LFGLNTKDGVCICWRLKPIVSNDTDEELWRDISQLRLVGVHDELSSTLSIIDQANLLGLVTSSSAVCPMKNYEEDSGGGGSIGPVSGSTTEEFLTCNIPEVIRSKDVQLGFILVFQKVRNV
jgi:hypothetical protein